MNFKHLRFLIMALLLLVGAVLLAGCSDDNEGTVVVSPPALVTSYDEIFGWTCDSGESCQDVYNIEFAAGAVVDISAIDVTGGSVLQMALYAPGVGLGELNIFTGTADELLCGYVSNCLDVAAGQVVTGLVIGEPGVYRLAITRDWATSCGSSGDYRVVITSDLEFTSLVTTGQDVASKASGAICP